MSSDFRGALRGAERGWETQLGRVFQRPSQAELGVEEVLLWDVPHPAAGGGISRDLLAAQADRARLDLEATGYAQYQEEMA